MKMINTIALAIACIPLAVSSVKAQGCVAVRRMSCAAPAGVNPANYFNQRTGTWQVSAGYRFVRSYKHFVGDVEQKERVEPGTQVINVSRWF